MTRMTLIAGAGLLLSLAATGCRSWCQRYCTPPCPPQCPQPVAYVPAQPAYVAPQPAGTCPPGCAPVAPVCPPGCAPSGYPTTNGYPATSWQRPVPAAQ